MALATLVSCSPISQHYNNVIPQSSNIIAQYSGTYACGQGTTGLELQVLSSEPSSPVQVVFNFVPIEANPDVPNGSFLMDGQFDLTGGTLDLRPQHWITRPAFYTMVGLSGSSIDGGVTFTGSVRGDLLDSLSCSTFRVKRLGSLDTGS